VNANAIRIDQCLFGYDEGHRLVASSLALGDATATLTHLSDLAPGTTFRRSLGYWTGLPLPRLKRYALMYTWPAPEMPRPGCVWTHALLLDLTIFDHLDDLLQLKHIFKRPESPSDRASYRDPIVARFEKAKSGKLENHLLPMAERLLEALYDGDGKVLAAAPGRMDQPVFAVWSQQWPRLRRNFRFQTAVSRNATHGGDYKFDVLFDLEEGGKESPRLGAAPWKSVALKDLQDPGGSDLREFLQRYGADVRKQRGSFRPLCEASTLRDVDSPNGGRRLLSLVEREFPDPDDALQLKQDVVDGRFAPAVQLEILSTIIGDKDRQHRLPRPSAEGVEGLVRFWPNHDSELVALAEEAAASANPDTLPILQAITQALPFDRFWPLTSSAPRVRRMMVEARPELLLSPGVEDIDAATLITFMDFLPDSTENAAIFVERMLTRSDAMLVSAIFDRFPLIAACKVVEAANRASSWPSEIWFRGLVARPGILFDAGLITTLLRSSLLYDVADAFGWITEETKLRGVTPWLSALTLGREDLPDERRDALYAFLLVLAFLSPGEDAKAAIEKTFSAVHRQILASRLSWKAQSILYPHLPDVGWMQNWDIGLRLRLGVAYTYITNMYDPASFGRLDPDRRVRDLLGDAADMFKGGGKYEKATKQR
jgi:hypothetical protein